MIGSLAAERVNAGEYDWIGAPTWAWRGEGNVPTTIYCHGSGGSARGTAGDRMDFDLNLALARDHVAMFGDYGLETWGNDMGGDRVHKAVLYAREHLGSSGPVVLTCASMGFLTAANYARRYPENVAAIAAVIPAVSIADVMVAAGPNSDIAAKLNAAYPPGFTDANQGQTHSPIHMAERGLLPTDLPIKFWCIEADPLTRIAPAQAFVAARPQTELELITEPWAYHGSIAVFAAQPEVLQWIKEVTA